MIPMPQKRARMTIRTKMNLLVLINTLVTLVLVLTGFSYMVIRTHFQEKGEEALGLAKAIANMPAIVGAFHTPNPSATIQPLTEQIRNQTGAEFIVIGNMQLIRYSHPNPDEIGKRMVGNDDALVLQGQPSISEAVGTLGLSIRGKAPVFDQSSKEIGVVSVGFLVKNIWQQIFVSLFKMAGLGTAGLAISFLGANLLSGHLKKQIFNMEPGEIAFLALEQAAILESIYEGILAINSEGRITACNQHAKRMLGLSSSEVLGEKIADVIHHPRLCEILEGGATGKTVGVDLPMIIGNTLVVVHPVPVLLNDQSIGAVATFRDKMELDQFDERLADVNRYVDALRSQRHEFMNRLHTISGLIQLREYDLVQEYIADINEDQQRTLEFFMARIKDSAVVGTLIGKLHRAKELGVQLIIDSKSQLSDPCPHREIVVTILANAIENALEAMSYQPQNAEHQSSQQQGDDSRRVTVYIDDGTENLVVNVGDTGPGIDPHLGNRVFEDGISTKGQGRGFGLALLSQLVLSINGKLAIESSQAGAILEAVLPKK
jgi:two-component system, CitB family, sensor kinase